MKTIKEILDTHYPPAEMKLKSYRFQVYVKTNDEKKKTVGMAYLREGQTIYTLRLWTLLDEKFYLLPSKEDPTNYLVMTRELNKSQSPTKKYFWNIVGNAKANSSQTALEVQFDLFEKKILMSLYPEASATPMGKPLPELVSDVA